MVKVCNERNGVAFSAFLEGAGDLGGGGGVGGEHGGLSFLRSVSAFLEGAGDPGGEHGGGVQTVKISHDRSDPAGLRFLEFAEPGETLHRKKWVLGEGQMGSALMGSPHFVKVFRRGLLSATKVQMPIRMAIYIGVYTTVSTWFYAYMIKPWQDTQMDEEAEGNLAVKVNTISFDQ